MSTAPLRTAGIARRPAEESGPPLNSTQPREQWLQSQDRHPRLALTQLACTGAEQPDKVAAGDEGVCDRRFVDDCERGPDLTIDHRDEQRAGGESLRVQTGYTLERRQVGGQCPADCYIV